MLNQRTMRGRAAPGRRRRSGWLCGVDNRSYSINTLAATRERLWRGAAAPLQHFHYMTPKGAQTQPHTDAATRCGVRDARPDPRQVHTLTQTTGQSRHKPRARSHWPQSQHSSHRPCTQGQLMIAERVICQVGEHGVDARLETVELRHQIAVDCSSTQLLTSKGSRQQLSSARQASRRAQV